MAKNGKRGRAAKASYFVPAGQGRYVYSGPLYSPDAESGVTAKKRNARRLFFSMGATVLSAVCGVLPVSGMMDTFYVIIPYALTLIFSAVLLWKSVRVAYWGGEKLREYVYNATVMKFPVLTLLCAAFAGASVVGEGIYLILNSTESLVLSLIFVLFHAAILALALLFRKFEIADKWNKTV